MSIRSRIATFEARNEEVRNSVPVKNGKVGTTDELMAPSEPRIVTPSSSSVAGRFRSTNLQPRKKVQIELGSSSATAIPVEGSSMEEIPRGVQRYQPLHQQYHQRQTQQRAERHAQQEKPPEGPEDEEVDQAARTAPPGSNGTYGSSPHRRAAHHQRRLEQMRRLEDSQRRLHESQRHREQQQQQKQFRKESGQENDPRAAEKNGESNKQYTSKTTTAQRLAKIQRMQRNRSMEKVRKNHQGTRLEEYDRPPSPEVQRDLSLQPSAADDEITLTSVRQIVGTTSANSSSPLSKTKQIKANRSGGGVQASGSRSVYPDEMTYTDDQDFYEEKSDKVHPPRGIRMSASSSSDEGGGRRDVVPAITSQLTPDVASFFEESQKRFLHPNSPNQEEENVSQESETFAQRKERERLEKVARDAAVEKAKAELDGPFLKAEDVDYYQKSINTPMVKTAVGVAVAASVGCAVLGPVGLLVGTAAVGIGVGVMQIPAEQRQNMEERATRTLRQVSDTAFHATESLSTACANSYQDSGLADHVPDEVNNCCAAIRESPTTDKSEMSAPVHSDGKKNGGAEKADDINAAYDADRAAEDTHPPPRLPPRRAGAACLREGTFTPVSLIYTLNPADQPRAWLDVLASAETTHDEKMEALEEIMILAKDKSRARILVEEGILDSIMWTLGRYFEKLYGPQQDDPQLAWAHPEITPQEARAAKLTANCCLQLGKAYCAAMHTDGDLMLMSLYERGTVPEERQLAQMLHEVPYHTRVTKTKDPTIVDPAGEVFAVVQMSLPQAEEFAKSVKALAHGETYQM